MEAALRLNIQFKTRELHARGGVECLPVNAAPSVAGPRLTQQHVLRDGQVAKISEFLVNRCDARFDGLAR